MTGCTKRPGEHRQKVHSISDAARQNTAPRADSCMAHRGRKQPVNLGDEECHLCLVAGNTVWSHMACEFLQQWGMFVNWTVILIYFILLTSVLPYARVVFLDEMWYLVSCLPLWWTCWQSLYMGHWLASWVTRATRTRKCIRVWFASWRCVSQPDVAV